MSKLSIHLAFAAALTLAFTAACDDGGTNPEAPDSAFLLLLADQAMAAADGDVDHVRAPGVPGLSFPWRVARFGIDDTPDCPFENGTFYCVHERFGGMSTVEITLLDADGIPQAAYDEELTASVELRSNLEGGGRPGRFSGSVSRSRDMTVTGLLGDETQRVWNGSSEGTSTRTHLQGPFAGETLTSTSASTIVDLTLPRPEDDEPGWPLSGVITTEISMSAGPRAGDHDVIVTFDGTQFATVNVDGEVMTVDLAERRRGPGHGLHHGHKGGGGG